MGPAPSATTRTDRRKLASIRSLPDDSRVSDIGSYASAELILGLVAPVGTDFERFFDNLRVCLSSFSYSAAQVRMSELSASFKEEGPVETDVVGSEEYRRLMRRMDAGNAARSRGGGDILALAAAAQIHAGRPDAHGSKGPFPNRPTSSGLSSTRPRF
jgi:hypothetical protein